MGGIGALLRMQAGARLVSQPPTPTGRAEPVMLDNIAGFHLLAHSECPLSWP